jgi:hypothetical protein
MARAAPRAPGRLVAVAAVAAVALGACRTNSPTYFEPPAPIEVGQAGGARSASATIALTFRPPSEVESRRLAEESASRGAPVPWIRRDDVALQIQYTLRNLGDRPAAVRLSVDGASEFSSYDGDALRQAATAANPAGEEPAVFSLIQPAPIDVEPGESRRGLIREDDFAEAALDLDAIGRFMAEPTSVLINRSEANPVGLERVPAGHVVPQLIRVKVAIASSAHVRLELLLRVRDEKGLLQEGGSGTFNPEPRPYAPPARMMPR